MPVLVTAAQLRAVLGVPNTLYDDTALNAKGYRSVVARSAADAIKTIEEYLNGQSANHE